MYPCFSCYSLYQISGWNVKWWVVKFHGDVTPEPLPCSCRGVCSPLLPCLLLRGFHGTLQGALEGLQLVQCLLQKKASHKLLQIGSFLIVLGITWKKSNPKGQALLTKLEIHKGRFRIHSEGKQAGCFYIYTCKPCKQLLLMDKKTSECPSVDTTPTQTERPKYTVTQHSFYSKRPFSLHR